MYFGIAYFRDFPTVLRRYRTGLKITAILCIHSSGSIPRVPSSSCTNLLLFRIALFYLFQSGFLCPKPTFSCALNQSIPLVTSIVILARCALSLLFLILLKPSMYVFVSPCLKGIQNHSSSRNLSLCR